MEVNSGFWGCTGHVFSPAQVGWECRSVSIVFLLEGMTSKWSHEEYVRVAARKEVWVYGKCVTFLESRNSKKFTVTKI